MDKIYFAVVLILAIIISNPAISYSAQVQQPVLVAHAGGLINNYIGTNSLEAIQESVKRGYQYIEVDIIRTSDNEFVLAHDWEYMSSRVPLANNIPVSKNTFMDYKIYDKYTPMTLQQLLSFLDKHPDITIITDTKNVDYAALKYISEQFPQYMQRFIPHVHFFGQYSYVKDLGYDKIIVAVYNMSDEIKKSPGLIASKAKELGAYGVAIPEELITSSEYANLLETDKINYFAHTVNSMERTKELLGMGIKGIYTDNIESGKRSSELSYITEYDLEYENRRKSLSTAIEQLSETEKKLLEDCLIYSLEDELMINKGNVEFIYDTSIGNCFVSTSTQKHYLPFKKTAVFLGATNFTYLSKEKSYTFDYGGHSYTMSADSDSYQRTNNRSSGIVRFDGKISIFCNWFFAAESMYKSIFGCDTVKANDFIIVAKNKVESPANYIAITAKLKRA